MGAVEKDGGSLVGASGAASRINGRKMAETGDAADVAEVAVNRSYEQTVVAAYRLKDRVGLRDINYSDPSTG